MRAYSKKQMHNSGFRTDDYKIIQRDGVFIARLDCKRWGNWHKLNCFFTLEDGSRVFATVWDSPYYLGIPEIETGEMLKLTFRKAKSGESYLIKAVKCESGKD